MYIFIMIEIIKKLMQIVIANSLNSLSINVVKKKWKR